MSMKDNNLVVLLRGMGSGKVNAASSMGCYLLCTAVGENIMKSTKAGNLIFQRVILRVDMEKKGTF